MDHAQEFHDDEARKLEEEVRKLREAQEAEISEDAKKLNREHYSNIRNLMVEKELEKPDAAKSLPYYDGGDKEAMRWNTEKEAMDSYRDSSLGQGVRGREIVQQMYSASDSTENADTSERREMGKVLTDDHEPGVSTHIHEHENGITISVKDQNTGKVERYNLNTGEGFEKDVSDMTSQEQQRRMRSEHTQENPNPDRDTIPGFHSSVWTKTKQQDDAEDET